MGICGSELQSVFLALFARKTLRQASCAALRRPYTGDPPGLGEFHRRSGAREVLILHQAFNFPIERAVAVPVSVDCSWPWSAVSRRGLLGA